ncbi:hypothetical protein BDV32DRAFT_155499 [Aspergillus pseudonomiae]|nr:hypothetical protein BDV32DRAFT_155499 [Aspergillus pseudonomiae]
MRMQVPFDAKGSSATGATVRGIMFAEASGGKEYLIVDIDRASQSAKKKIDRYHVNMTRAHGHYWIKIPQLFYVPIVNTYGQSPPSPRRLRLPNDAVPSAIASARNGLDTTADLHATNDLYVTSDLKLYWFAANKQTDSSSGTLLLDDDLFSQMTTLITMTHDGIVLPGSWSVLVPILRDIEHLSAYVNRLDGSKTVFASGGSNLFRIKQASLTGSKLWKPQKITLATHREQRTIAYKSYTSTLQVNDENGLPADKVVVSIATTARTSVFINGLYYVLSQIPVQVVTDRTRLVTVVEATEDMNAAILTVSCNGGSPQQVNPMSKSFDKPTSLTSEDALRGANVLDIIIAGGVVGSVQSVPIVQGSTNSQDLLEVTGPLKTLKDAHIAPHSRQGPSLDSFNKGVIPATVFYSSGSVNSHVIYIIKAAAPDTLYFIADIAGKVYRAISDSVEAIVGAIQWRFNIIKTTIEYMMRFVQFLFEWDDISRTKNVMLNIVRLYDRVQVEVIPEAQRSFDAEIDNLKKSLAQWGDKYTLDGVGDVVLDVIDDLLVALSQEGKVSCTQAAHRGHATAGFIVLMGDFLNVFEAEALTGDNPSITAAIASILAAAFQWDTDALVPKYPLIFCDPAQKKFATNSSWFAVADCRATGAVVKSILVITALCISGWHFYELSQMPKGTERSASIVGEVSNLTSYVSPIFYAAAVNDVEETTRNVAIGVMAVSNVATAGLQTAEAFLSRK